MLNSSILSIFVVAFVLLGVYNLLRGLQRLREARAKGQPIQWYKQINILTALEYLLFSLIFLIGLNFNSFPASLRSALLPVYFVILALAVILAGLVIRQGLRNARNSRQSARPQTSTKQAAPTSTTTNRYLPPEERAAKIQQRRQRRQKAAATRRRRTGKA